MRLLLSLLILFSLQACAMTSPATPSDATLYLVRHAEKLSGGDPALSEDGMARASRLAAQFADVPLQAVYSTDTRRTRQTAEPVAANHGLTVILYDANDLEGLAQTLKSRGRTALVVGHSNTTPDLVRLLGGAAEYMPESDYERLYRVSPASGETALLVAGGDPL